MEHFGAVANIYFITLDKNNGPLKNLKVRQALTDSIEHKNIVDALCSDRTAMPQGFQHSMLGDLFATDRRTQEYNAELAKKLLAESRYNGVRIASRVHPDYYSNEVNLTRFNL